MYEKRIIDESLKSYFEDFPAILIEGAKAVGKTETCSQTQFRFQKVLGQTIECNERMITSRLIMCIGGCFFLIAVGVLWPVKPT